MAAHERSVAIASAFRDQSRHFDSKRAARRISRKVAHAVRRRGDTLRVDEHAYEAQVSQLRHALIDQQHWISNPDDLPGSHILDLTRSSDFVKQHLFSKFAQSVDDLLRLGCDGAGTKAAMAGAGATKYKLTYAHLSHPVRGHRLKYYVIIGALEDEDGPRLRLFIHKIRYQIEDAHLSAYLHGDTALLRACARSGHCPFCGVSDCTLHLDIMNRTDDTHIRVEICGLPGSFGLLHFLCILISALLTCTPGSTLSDVVLGFSTFNISKRQGGEWDALSIKEFDRLCDDPSLAESVYALVPPDVKKGMQAVVDMRKYYQHRSDKAWSAMMQAARLPLQKHGQYTSGCHMGWHAPIIARRIGGLPRMVEQGLEHVNGEVIKVRAAHAITSIPRALAWRNALHAPASAMHATLAATGRPMLSISATSFRHPRETDLARLFVDSRLPNTERARDALGAAERLSDPPLTSYLADGRGRSDGDTLVIWTCSGSTGVIGYSAVAVGADRLPVLFDTFVLPDHRRLGIASALLDRVLAWTRLTGSSATPPIHPARILMVNHPVASLERLFESASIVESIERRTARDIVVRVRSSPDDTSSEEDEASIAE